MLTVWAIGTAALLAGMHLERLRRWVMEVINERK